MAFPFRQRVVLLGASMTQFANATESGEAGWGALLAARYSRKVDFLNRGYSGYNTRQALALLPTIFPPQGEDPLLFATVFFGANDSAAPTSTPVQHVPLEEYEGNLRRIVQHIRTSGCDHVLIVTAPPVDSARWPDRSNAVLERYAAAARRAAEAEGALIVDVYAAMQQSPTHVQDYLGDGLHLNGKGNALVAELILKTLPAEVQEPSLPLDAPLWRDMSPENPAESLARHRG